jgi:hypothetical protein
MGTAYKRQHYLPAGYLKYFSIDQTDCERDSWLWRFDGQTQCRVTVESQCASNFHYSKEDPASAEKTFHDGEGRYCKCVDKIKKGLVLTNRESGGLLANLFDFYIRNAVHKNETGKEGIEAYRKRVRIFYSQILLKKTENITEHDIRNHIARQWRLEIVSVPFGRGMITSDNPSVWTAISDRQPGLHLLTLPITPTQIAVAADIRFVRILPGQMSEPDYLTLMDSQMHNAVSSIYSSIDFTPEIMAIAKNRFSMKKGFDCYVNEASWKTTFARLEPEHYFSFMQIPPPLM